MKARLRFLDFVQDQIMESNSGYGCVTVIAAMALIFGAGMWSVLQVLS